MVFGDPSLRFSKLEDSVLRWGAEQPFPTWAALASRWHNLLWPIALPRRTASQLRRRSSTVKARAAKIARKYATVLAAPAVLVQWSSGERPEEHHDLAEREAALAARRNALEAAERDARHADRDAGSGSADEADDADCDERTAEQQDDDPMDADCDEMTADDPMGAVCPICLESLNALAIVQLECGHALCTPCFSVWAKAR